MDDLHENAATIQRGYRRHLGAKHQPQAQRVAREMASKKNDPPHWYKRAVEQGATPLANVGKTPAALAKEKAVAAATLAAKVRANYAPGARVNVVKKAAPPAPPASEAAAAADEAAFQASAARPPKRGEAPAATKARRDARNEDITDAYALQDGHKARLHSDHAIITAAERIKINDKIRRLNTHIQELEEAEQHSVNGDDETDDVEGEQYDPTDGTHEKSNKTSAIKSLANISIGGFSEVDANKLYEGGFISFKNKSGATMFRRREGNGLYRLSNKSAALKYLTTGAKGIPTHIVIDGSKAPHPPSHLRGKH